MKNIELGFDARSITFEAIDAECSDLLLEVENLRADVADSREEVDSILSGLFPVPSPFWFIPLEFSTCMLTPKLLLFVLGIVPGHRSETICDRY